MLHQAQDRLYFGEDLKDESDPNKGDQMIDDSCGSPMIQHLKHQQQINNQAVMGGAAN